jgi:murein DD-endopeptidase MepM/ murein hydrolase activator NlpD
MSQPMAESPRRPSAQERRSLPPRRFEASLEALERDGVISPTERVRVHGGLIAPMNAARRQACSSGALSALECGSGVVVRGRGRLDGAGFSGGDGDVGLSGGGASGGSGERYGLSGGGETSAVGRFSTDAMPLPPISVPVSALLSGAGGSFRLTDVFGRTPRPAAIAGNGNSGLMYPLIGSAVVTSPFGWRLHPVMGTWLMHAGRDLAAPEGTPVVAALHGRVVSSGLAGGYGLAIEIEHDGPRRRTLYGHLSELYVKEGQEVRQGEVIGRVGSTGLSTGPHLHFEVRMPQEGGWVAVDPGELDPGGAMAMIASQPGKPGQPGAVPIDAVALLMGELIQTLERPRSPLALPGAADPSLGQPSPAPAPNPKG